MRLVNVSIVLFLLMSAGALPSDKKQPGNSWPQIVGGEDTPQGEYPWIAAVLFAGELSFNDIFLDQFCAGLLIHPQWVLTSAHCVANEATNQALPPESFEVAVGVWDLDAPATREPLEKIIVHPHVKVNLVGNAVDNDVALLKLQNPQQTASLPLLFREDLFALPGDAARILGWGVVDPGDPDTGTFPEFPAILQQADVEIIDPATCRSPDYYGERITDTMICAGFADGGVDSCQGDSGGPLIVDDGNGGWLLAGLTSFGDGCAEEMKPGIYTRVSRFYDWVWSVIHNPLEFSQFGSGMGLRSDVVVNNLSGEEAAEGTIQFLDELGAAASVEIASTQGLVRADSQQIVETVDFSIPPRGTITVSTTSDGELVQGSVRVSSSSKVDGVIRFNLPPFGIAGVGAGQPSRAASVPVRRNAGVNTGVAIKNISPDMLDLSLILLDGDGNEVEVVPLELQPGERVSKFINEYFFALEDFSGSVIARVDSPVGTIVVMGLELGSAGGEFTTLPASPLP